MIFDRTFWTFWHSYTMWKVDASSCLIGRIIGGGCPLLLEILVRVDPPPSKRHFQLVFACSASAVTLTEKSSVITNGKSTIGFPMSVRWTAFVAAKPLKRAQTCKVTVLHTKVDFSPRKSATKFLCVKTVSDSRDRVARHSLAYLTVHKWLVGDVPFVPKVNHPFARQLCASAP